MLREKSLTNPTSHERGFCRGQTASPAHRALCMARGHSGLCQTCENRTRLWMPTSVCCHLGEADCGWSEPLVELGSGSVVRGCVCVCMCVYCGRGRGEGQGVSGLVFSRTNQTAISTSISTRMFSVVGERVHIKCWLQGHTSVSDGNLFFRAGQEEHFLRAARYLAVSPVERFQVFWLYIFHLPARL